MRKIYYPVLFLLVIFLSSPLTAIAQESAVPSFRSAAPDVYVQNVDATARENRITGSFRVVNGEDGAVGGIDYIIMLISERPDVPEGQIIGDDPLIYGYEYVSDNLSLSAKEEKNISFSYDIPNLPEGEYAYRLRIQMTTSNGRELGWDDKDINLRGRTDNYIELLPLFVLAESTDPFIAEMLAEAGDGDEDSEAPYEEDLSERYRHALDSFMNFNDSDLENMLHRDKWDPLEGPNVDPGAEVGLQARFTNLGLKDTGGNLIVSYRRDLTDRTQFETGIIDSISLSSKEEVTRDVSFKAPTVPGVYEIFLAVEDESGNRISTIGEYRLVVKGASASIVGVKAQDIGFIKGDIIVLDVSVVGSADRETVLQGTLEITIFDGDKPAGHVTSSIELDAVRRDTTSRIQLDRNIETIPAARVVIRDDQGRVLDEYEIEFPRVEALSSLPLEESVAADTGRSWMTGLTALFALLVLGVIALYLLKHDKGNGGPPPSGFTKIGVLALFIGTGLVVFASQLNAFHETSVRTHQNRVGGTWERTGNSMSIDGGDFGYSIYVNSPRQEVLEIEPGQTVPYSARAAMFDACANRTRHHFMWVHLAENGGSHNSHSSTSWVQQGSLPMQAFSAGAQRGGISRTLAADLIFDSRVDSEEKATIWTESWWLSMRNSSVINRAYFTFLLTPLTVNIIAEPRETDDPVVPDEHTDPDDIPARQPFRPGPIREIN